MTTIENKTPKELFGESKRKTHENLCKLLGDYNKIFGEQNEKITISDAQKLAHFNDLIEAPLYYLKSLTIDN